jgi:hypothetical protein
VISPIESRWCSARVEFSVGLPPRGTEKAAAIAELCEESKELALGSFVPTALLAVNSR